MHITGTQLAGAIVGAVLSLMIGGLYRFLRKLYAVVNDLAIHVKPNGGMSMGDTVNRIEPSVNELNKVVHSMDDQLDRQDEAMVELGREFRSLKQKQGRQYNEILERLEKLENAG